MSAYSFVKETNGFSITKDGLKVRYGDVSFRGFPKGDVAQIQISEFKGSRLSDYDINLSSDTVSVNSVVFSGTATELIDELGDTVLFKPANGSGGAVSEEAFTEAQADIVELFTKQAVADYVIEKVGATVTAKPRLGSSLIAYSGTDAYTVIQAAIDALQTGRGGRIHISNGQYALTNELTITGWSALNPPDGRLTITGDGYGSYISQNTAAKNGIVVKNKASITFQDFKIYTGASSYSAILLDDTGSGYEISVFGGLIDNVLAISDSTTKPAVWIKNTFDLSVPTLSAYNSNNEGLRVESTGSGTIYGNAHFGFLRTYASPAHAGLSLKGLTNYKSVNLISFDNYQCISGLYGVYGYGVSACTINLIDVEYIKYPIFFDGDDTHENIGNKVLSGYIYPQGSGACGITVNSSSSANTFACHVQTDDGITAILNDQKLYRAANTYDLTLSFPTDITKVTIAEPNNTYLKLVHPESTYQKVPNPLAADDSQSIATTSWVREHVASAGAVSLLPLDSKIVYFGDSITEAGKILSGTTTSFSTRGHAAWTNVLSGSKFNPVNLGVGGNTTGNMVDRAYSATLQNPKAAVVLGGANDLIGSGTAAQIIDNLRTIYNAFLAVNSKVIAITILPTFSTYTLTGPKETIRQTVNTWIKAQTDVIVVDAESVMNNASYYHDGLHTNGLGGYYLGALIATELNKLMDANAISGLLLPGIGYTTNPLITGTTGAKTLSTGNVATSWNLDGTNSGGTTIVASKDASDKQILTISGNYTGNARVVEFFQAYSTAPPVAGDKLEGFLDYDIVSAYTNITSVHFQIQVYTTGYGSLLVNEFGLTPYDANNIQPIGNYVDRTSVVPIGAGTPALVINRVRIVLKDTASSLPVSGVIKINKLGVRKIA